MTGARPVPVPDERSRAFWDAAALGVLAIQRCCVCGHLHHPPALVCSACRVLPPEFDHAPLSGHATLCTWTVMRDSFLPGFDGGTPWVVAVGELLEQPGLRLLATLADGPDAALHIGLPLQVSFETRSDGCTLPVFRLAQEAP